MVPTGEDRIRHIVQLITDGGLFSYLDEKASFVSKLTSRTLSQQCFCGSKRFCAQHQNPGHTIHHHRDEGKTLLWTSYRALRLHKGRGQCCGCTR
ncbi:hypothetical protein M404DRAFT_250316 [Pisolithus tinctorius Marx 270]|uniref:Uncharacterized protein n=1 Tax=Pisolithus tinctorius Marx 270 TaxID=870435 RepID=A0A0C3NKW1_PISTI|nr:hypothetical protein M404DRAFT_250316 [Pisolithus tinctorius Marx 270]